jgi:hypothetical protein
MSSPFDIPAMHALRRRLARQRPHVVLGSAQLRSTELNVGMLKVWNGNEGRTLQQLIDAVPPTGGIKALVRDMEKAS